MIVFNREQYEGKPAPAPRGFTANADDYWDTPDDGDYLRRLALGFEHKGDLRRARAYHRAADVIDPPAEDEPEPRTDMKCLQCGFEFRFIGDRNPGLCPKCGGCADPDEPEAALVEARFALETAQSNLAALYYAMPYHGNAKYYLDRVEAHIAYAMTALPGGES